MLTRTSSYQASEQPLWKQSNMPFKDSQGGSAMDCWCKSGSLGNSSIASRSPPSIIFPMSKCLGKLSCTSSTFSIANQNRTCFLRSAKTAIRPISGGLYDLIVNRILKDHVSRCHLIEENFESLTQRYPSQVQIVVALVH